jgi:predicted HicB family RNase H-like nuclease
MNKRKEYQDRKLMMTFRFKSARLRAAATKRAKAEGRSLTQHINELIKADAAI